MFQTHEVKWSTTVWTQPDQNLPRFCFVLFCFGSAATVVPFTILHEFSTVLLAQLLEQVIYLFEKALAMANLRKLGLLTKNLNCLFASLVVESSQKSLMILKMLLSLKALSLWSPWHRVSLTLIDKHIILVLNEQNNECLKSWLPQVRK